MKEQKGDMPVLTSPSFRIKLSKEGIVQDKLTIGGIIAFSLIILQAFISFQPQSLDISTIIAMGGFAVGIPLLVAYTSLCDHLEIEDPVLAPRDIICLYSVGLLSAVIGMAAAFWHLSASLGMLFVGSSLVGLGVIIHHIVGRGTLGKNSRYTKPPGKTPEP